MYTPDMTPGEWLAYGAGVATVLLVLLLVRLQIRWAQSTVKEPEPCLWVCNVLSYGDPDNQIQEQYCKHCDKRRTVTWKEGVRTVREGAILPDD